MNDVANMTRGNLELFCYGCLCCSFGVAISYFLNFDTSQFVKMVTFTKYVTHFSNTVMDVFKSRSNEKVIRVDAIRDIAFVANVHSLRYLSFRKFPRQSVNVFRFSFVGNDSVSSFCLGSSPKPAKCCFLGKKVYPVLNLSALGTGFGSEFFNMNRGAVDLFSASVTLGKHLKLFLLGVKGAIGSSRWLPLHSTEMLQKSTSEVRYGF